LAGLKRVNDHPDVVPDTAEHRIYGISQGSCELIVSQLAIGLHIANGRSDGAAALEHPRSCISLVAQEQKRTAANQLLSFNLF
jgi:hypothetical protein